jgi:alpha-L-fucosidase 2
VFLHLLPALPSAWPTGTVSGLRARGGMEAALAWAGGKLTRATITARETKPVKVRYAGKEVEFQAQAGRTYEFGPELKKL